MVLPEQYLVIMTEVSLNPVCRESYLEPDLLLTVP